MVRLTSSCSPLLVLAMMIAVLIALRPAPAGAQGNADDWVLLASVPTETSAGTQTIALPANQPRVRAIRLAAQGGRIGLDRIVISYANGQMHYESRPITLAASGAGAYTRPLNQREEALIVEAVELHFAGGTAPARATVAVWGLRADRAAAGLSAKSAPWGLGPRGEQKVSAPPGSTPEGRYVEVPVFFATTRQREKDRSVNGRQAASFSGVQGRELLMGRTVVTVPLARQAGTLSRAPTVPYFNYKLFRDDPNQHFLIAAVDVLPRTEVVSQMRGRVTASRAFKGQALVFVHGYNVNFDDAMLRAAQIAHDMGFDGPAIAHSWPAGGRLFDYSYDTNTSRTSAEGLRTLLEMIATQTGATSVNIIAHSMGNHPLLDVLREQVQFVRRGARVADLRLNEVVFAAPDVDRTHFAQFTAGLSAIVKGGLTLYASRNDLALKVSKSLFSQLPRAGDVPTPEGIVVVPGVESIDVSGTSTSFFSVNHSHFADRPHLLADMKLLFERTTDKHPPHVRFPVYRQKEERQKGRWWEYLK